MALRVCGERSRCFTEADSNWNGTEVDRLWSSGSDDDAVFFLLQRLQVRITSGVKQVWTCSRLLLLLLRQNDQAHIHHIPAVCSQLMIERFDVLRHTKQETELQQAAFTIKRVGWSCSCWRRGINFLCVIYQSLVQLHHGGGRSSGGDDDETNSVNNSTIDKVSPLNRASSSDPAVGGA